MLCLGILLFSHCYGADGRQDMQQFAYAADNTLATITANGQNVQAIGPIHWTGDFVC